MPDGDSKALRLSAVKRSVKALIGIIRVRAMGATRHRRSVAIVTCIWIILAIILAIIQQPLSNQEPKIMTLREPGTLQSRLQVL
jgi:hypothetical protein